MHSAGGEPRPLSKTVPTLSKTLDLAAADTEYVPTIKHTAATAELGEAWGEKERVSSKEAFLQTSPPWPLCSAAVILFNSTHDFAANYSAKTWFNIFSSALPHPIRTVHFLVRWVKQSAAMQALERSFPEKIKLFQILQFFNIPHGATSKLGMTKD